MEKEFVRYDESLALKELGFDEPCLKLWEKTMMFTILVDPSEFKKVVSERYVEAPLYQQSFKWFRKNYGLEHKIIRDSYGCRYQITKVTRTSMEEIDCKGQLSNTSYDEAELECLKKLIEIVKENK